MPDTTRPMEIVLKLGERGEDFAKRYASLLDKDVQPAGLAFYEIDISSKQQANAQLSHEGYSLTIPYLSGAVGVLDFDYSSLGIEKFRVYVGLTADKTLSNEAARLYINSLLQQFRSKGWKPYFYLSDPRLRGQEQFEYALTGPLLALDGDYDLTPQNWERIDWISSPFWMFYADHVFAKLQFRRSPTWEDPNQPGVAMLSIEFQTMENSMRLEFEEKDRRNWRALWPAKALDYRQYRDAEEIRQQQAGKHIDIHYQDPPMPPAPAGQQNPPLPIEVTRPANPALKPVLQQQPKRDSLPIGTRCKTGERCPQGGVWRVEMPDGHISAYSPSILTGVFIAKGAAMPAFYVIRERKNFLLQYLFGYQEGHEPVVWKLAAYQ